MTGMKFLNRGRALSLDSGLLMGALRIYGHEPHRAKNRPCAVMAHVITHGGYPQRLG